MGQPRRMLVLRAVVEDYIRSQEPVGSTTLAQQHHFGVSPATIRNDMAVLESEGYLEQPHTSAGRIPTDRGYRYFVDQLSRLVPLSRAQRTGIATFLSRSVSLQDALRRAARLLAAITGQVAVVSSPALARSRMRHIEIVPLASSIFLAVVITDAGSVAQHTFHVHSMPAADEVNQLSVLINRQCFGMPLRESAEHIRSLASASQTSQGRVFVDELARTLESMSADEEAGEELYMAGTSQLAHRNASADLGPLFDALEEQVVLIHLMSDMSEEQSEVNVAIGSETHTPGLLKASVVTSGYGRRAGESRETGESRMGDMDSTPVAFVGSIGPTHMDYAATITAVRAVARYLTRFVSNQGVDDA
ncbi:heat-inducible transcriptional repressor HrcA [Bifidobacterium bombi]|uniref:Heat-inducible transcription repressor HrcA n=1 Tax=Bifidobacterium bombi DSM 19703 TaxID=1341695 RepID=A0A080N2Y5_9BIFI|nr:heat-inducible transcriptional repressor HrcA [Bifidobacterium bombi]KFF31256.1 heat-inducible transcription repressor HrcA [Bifidobacterium bombi DSM 19703]